MQDDMQNLQSIHREIQTHVIMLRNALQRIDSGFKVDALGSYRRGRSLCPQIRIAIGVPAVSSPDARTGGCAHERLRDENRPHGNLPYTQLFAGQWKR